MLRYIRKLKFRTKLFIACLMCSLIPTLVLGSFSYRKANELLIEREELALRDTLIQESLYVSSQLTSFQDISKYIVWDSNLLGVLSQTYDTNSQMYRAYTHTVEPYFSTLHHLFPNINDIVIYTDLQIYSRTGVIESLSEIEQCSWYPEACRITKPMLICSDNTLSVINRFVNIPMDISAFIQLDIPYENVFSRLTSIFNSSYGISLFDENGNQFWQFLTEDMQEQTTFPDQLSDIPLTDFSSKIIVETLTDENTGWTYYIYRPTSTITAPTKSIFFVVSAIIFCCILLVILFSYFLSRVLVQPLKKLAANMEKITQNNYKVTVTYSASDEIGQLISNFTTMANQLNYLINEQLKTKIQQQKLEFQALQAQINPHFLYNTLSLINSKAILAGHSEIGEAARYLTTFYRTSLNKGSDLILIKDELANIQSYINIQLLMHSDSFDVSYDIDKDILQFTIPNLMLQPLVENAILHGIDGLDNGSRRGSLKITAKVSDDTLVFCISDNGPGIPESKLATLLSTKSRHYGVENVHRRAQLQYGSRFGLHYHSQIGSGTEVTLTIPKIS